MEDEDGVWWPARLVTSEERKREEAKKAAAQGGEDERGRRTRHQTVRAQSCGRIDLSVSVHICGGMDRSPAQGSGGVIVVLLLHDRWGWIHDYYLAKNWRRVTPEELTELFHTWKVRACVRCWTSP